MNLFTRRFLPLMLLATLASSPALAAIPDFNVFNAPESVRKAGTPNARKFWADLVEHSKTQGRKMFEDTKKQTGLKNGDMRKKDWDCLFWRTAATFARSVLSKHPGLQPLEFSEELTRTALDPEDCDDDGKGPGGRGVQVYTAATNNIIASRNGWQKTATAPVPPAPTPARTGVDLIQYFATMGVVIGKAAEGAATVAGGLVPVLFIPSELVEEWNPGGKAVKPL